MWPYVVTESLQNDEPVLPTTVRCDIVRTLVLRMSDRQMLKDSDFVDVADESLRRMPHLRTKSANSGVLVRRRTRSPTLPCSVRLRCKGRSFDQTHPSRQALARCCRAWLDDRPRYSRWSSGGGLRHGGNGRARSLPRRGRYLHRPCRDPLHCQVNDAVVFGHVEGPYL